MAVIHCNECDQFVDDDYFPCEVDPRDDCEMICPSCAEDSEEEDDDEL